MIHPKRFEEIKASRQLPSPSGVVLNVLRLADDEDTTAAEIARVLQTDPALAGRILKYANSAYVGTTIPVVAVRDAVSRLGTRCIRRLALGFSLLSQYRRGGCQRFNHQQYWSRSLAAAIAAQMLSRATRQGNSDEIFICGLLSEVGALALATMHPEAYDDVLARSEGKSFPDQLRLERQCFAMDQVDLTAAMLEDWGLPDEYVSAVRIQGHPESSFTSCNPGALVLLLRVARRIAAYCNASENERLQRASEVLEQAGRIDLDSTALSLLSDQTAREWQDWGKIMEVPTVEVPSLVEVAQQGRTSGAAPTCNQTDSGLPALRVLIADDDPISLCRLAQDVQASGHEVITATNGQQALHLALETWPQIILCDSLMPGMDGIEFCRLLRKTRPGQQIYVIILAGSDQDEHVVAALDAGADDYCVKPWNPRVLAARLRAGQRAIQLQRALEHEKEEVRLVAARLAVANRQLEQNAYTDSLTGLPNRAYARDSLLSAWAVAVREDRPLTCMMIDVDHFKRVNDTFGHDVGDLVLQRTATALRTSVRGSDLICRLGGEEFLLICKNTALQDGVMAADRLRRGVAANRIKAPGFEGTVTVSIGVASRIAEMNHPDELLKEADRAVYAAKHAGRNCVRSAATVAAVTRASALEILGRK